MTADPRPLITLDLDGVICDPPFGINLGISADFLDPAAPPRPARVPPLWFSTPADALRFNFRRPIAGVAEALRDLHEIRTIYLLTGRRTPPTAWLRRHGIEAHLHRVLVNDTALRSPHFKLQAIARLGAQEHVDDDGRTAQLLAERSQARIYLCDWPRNRNARYAETITRVASLAEAVRLIREREGASGPRL